MTLRNRFRSAKENLSFLSLPILARGTHGKSPAGVPLPPLTLRMGGQHFRSDEALVASAAGEVDRLVRFAQLGPNSTLLDWGCGPGRLAIGIIERFGRVRSYSGVDVQKVCIEWAQRHIGRRDGFNFVHVNVPNERYNPSGADVRQIPGESHSVDVFYAYSVFSHLNGSDASAYMAEISRLLAPNGRAVVTAFVEQDVPPEEENPSDYGPLRWSGRLHCVRFEKNHFESFIFDAGLAVELFEYGQETDGQSSYVLRRATERPQ